jgi:hypothetical protein
VVVVREFNVFGVGADLCGLAEFRAEFLDVTYERFHVDAANSEVSRSADSHHGWLNAHPRVR